MFIHKVCVVFFLLADVVISCIPLKHICLTLQPSGLLIYLDSSDKVPDSALEQEHLNTRDNLKIAQDHANRNRRGQHWITIERQIRVLEKHVEVTELDCHKDSLFIIKANEMHYFSTLFWKKNSTCFGQTYCPSSGVSTLYSQQ